MIFFDIAIIVLTFVMVLFYLPRLGKSMKRDRKLCKVCNVDMLANTSTRSEVEKASREYARGTCDLCHAQNCRDLNLDEVFTSNIKSNINKRIKAIIEWACDEKRTKLTLTLFISSSIIGILPVFGLKYIILKVAQLLFLCLGWLIIIIKMKKY